jgi:hypothetical protein
MDVAYFCGSRYSFLGDLGGCPACGDYVGLARVSDSEEEEMRAELALLLGGAATSGESRHAWPPGRPEV